LRKARIGNELLHAFQELNVRDRFHRPKAEATTAPAIVFEAVNAIKQLGVLALPRDGVKAVKSGAELLH
jgi:hypothetical protein